MRTTRELVIAITTSLFFSVLAGAEHAHAQTATTSQPNTEAVKAAIEADVPPLAEAIYGAPGRFASLGPPGPYFPDRAQRLRQGGVAVLRCEADAKGHLSACTVLAEGPTTFDFGAATLHMASAGYLRVNVTAAPPSEVRVVVIFPTPRS